jgi:hypothetical protein
MMVWYVNVGYGMGNINWHVLIWNKLEHGYPMKDEQMKKRYKGKGFGMSVIKGMLTVGT